MGNIRYTTPRHAGEVEEVARRAKAGDARAVLELVQLTAPLVFKQILKKGMPQRGEEMASLAHLAVLETLAIYEPERAGGSFTGLAWIVAARVLDQEAARSSTALSMSLSRRDKHVRMKARRYMREAEEEGASESQAIEYAADRLRITAQELTTYLRAFTADGDESLSMLHLADESEPADEGIAAEQRARLIAEALSGLEDRDAEIVRMYAGGMTFDAIAQQKGITRERIRQRYNRAMEHVRAWFDARGLELSDLL